MWSITLELLENEPSKLIGKIDWITKKYIIDKKNVNSKSNLNDLAKSIDFQYSEITSGQNIFNILNNIYSILLNL